MKTGLDKLSSLKDDVSKVKQQTVSNGTKVGDTLSSSKISIYTFPEDMELSDARERLLDFSYDFTLSAIKTMDDFIVLQKVISEMSKYLLDKQYEIIKLPPKEEEDLRVNFITIQATLLRMSDDEDFIKRIVTKDGTIDEDPDLIASFTSETKYLHSSLGVVYNAIVGIDKSNFIDVPKEMAAVEKFSEPLDPESLAKNAESFSGVLMEIKDVSNYILDNKEEIGKFPAMQLHDFKHSLEGIIGEVQVLLGSGFFNKKQMESLGELNKSDSELHQAHDTINDSLKFKKDQPLEKSVELISTMKYRINKKDFVFGKSKEGDKIYDEEEQKKRVMAKFQLFLNDIRAMSSFILNSKEVVLNLSSKDLKLIEDGLRDIQIIIKIMLETEELSPKIVFNLQKLTKKDLHIARSIVETDSGGIF